MDNANTEHKADAAGSEINQSSLTTQNASADELAAMRDLIVKAHPDVVPELLTGSNFQELTASLPAAQKAYAAIAEQVKSAGSVAGSSSTGQAAATPPNVPAASPPLRPGIFVDVAALPTSEMISRGIEARKKR